MDITNPQLRAQERDAPMPSSTSTVQDSDSKRHKVCPTCNAKFFDDSEYNTQISCGTVACNKGAFKGLRRRETATKVKKDQRVEELLEQILPPAPPELILSVDNPQRLKTCPSCLKVYHDKTRRNLKQFCSNFCKSKFNKEPVSERYKLCGCGEHYLDNSPSNNKKYCEYCRKKIKGPRTRQKRCWGCDKTFIDSSPGNNMRYCKKECRLGNRTKGSK